MSGICETAEATRSLGWPRIVVIECAMGEQLFEVNLRSVELRPGENPIVGDIVVGAYDDIDEAVKVCLAFEKELAQRR